MIKVQGESTKDERPSTKDTLKLNMEPCYPVITGAK